MIRSPFRLLAAALALAGAVAATPSAAATRFRPVQDDLFYMYMPIAWRDSDADAWRFGDFGGMVDALPYLESLGVTAIWMTPIFVSPAYHGYQHGAADSIAPRFGTEAQFHEFVAAAHAESIKVFLDFVAYGISQSTPWFQDSYGNPGSIYDSWLAYTNEANTSYLGCCPYSTWDGSTVGFIHWDLRNPEVTQQVSDWAVHWLDPNADGNPEDGVDGFRLDHVSAYHPDESPWGYDLAWWESWKGTLQLTAPDVFTFAEQADWGSYGAELLTAHDAAFTKPFEFAARYGLWAEDARPLAGAMGTTLATLPAGRLYLTTLGNHDVDRLATVLGDVPGRLRAAAAAHLLQPLPPVIYFGDEIGMRGAKRFDFSGDAKDIPFREPFKWNAVAGLPMSNYFAANAQAYAERVSHDHDGRSVEEQSGVAGSLLEHYRALGALRRAHPALRRGDYYPVAAPDTAAWAFVKMADGETLLVVMNVGSRTLKLPLDLSAFDPAGGESLVRDVVSNEPLTPLTTANRAAYGVPLDPYAYRVLELHVSLRDLRRIFADANVVITQDSPSIVLDHAFELDQMFVRYEPGGLALAITGNLIEVGGLALFFDAVPGGQNTLATSSLPQPPSGLPQLSGMTFDAGFEPERVLYLNPYQNQLYADLYTLFSDGGGSKRYVGTVPVGGSGPLTGGDNPNGLRAAYAPHNRGGIAPGTANGAESATHGWEILVPWADLGLGGSGPGLRLLAALVVGDGYMLNQFLPGLRGHDQPLGYAPFDLGTIPGPQFVTLDNTTGTAITVLYAGSDGRSVEIVWRTVLDGTPALAVERRSDFGTSWAAIAMPSPDPDGLIRVTDAGVEPGRSYVYRLRIAATGEVLSEVRVDVPEPFRFALHRAAPNPAAEVPRFDVEVAAGAATLELIDVAGRVVRRLDIDARRAGRRWVELPQGRALAAGVYFAVLRQNGEARRVRVAIVR